MLSLVAVKAKRLWKEWKELGKRLNPQLLSYSGFQIFFEIPTSLPLSIFTGPGWIFPFQADVISGLQVSQYPVCCCHWLLQKITHSLWSERTSFLAVFATVWKVMPGKRNSTYHLSNLYDVRVYSFLLLTCLLKGGFLNLPGTKPREGTECLEGTLLHTQKFAFPIPLAKSSD